MPELIRSMDATGELRQNRSSFPTTPGSAMRRDPQAETDNLNLLGTREPQTYGSVTLEQINQRLAGIAVGAGHHLQTLQSNAEHELIERVHAARSEGIGFIVINPGGFTHTSVALRDALLGVAVPFIEVHISNVHAREPFRRHSYFSDVAVGVICGLGPLGYELALQAAIARLTPAT